MLKKRTTLIKLLILVPIVWILAVLLIGLNDSSEHVSDYSKDKIAKLEEQNNQLIAAAAAKHAEEKKAKLDKMSGGDSHNHAEDNDHPEEERKKAQEQQNKNAGPVQVHAPVDRNLNAPGELGKPVFIDKDKLSPEERVKFDNGWKNNAFNNYVSDMISVHRSLADIRDPACKALKWYDPLPTTSVIVIFHNEAWSVLLRTIHSVLDRSDPKILVEVIVVDDFSDFGKLVSTRPVLIWDLFELLLIHFRAFKRSVAKLHR